jgi:acyl-CoA dehydrogenase
MQNPFETEERKAFRETIRRYVETEITPNIDEWDEAGDFPWRIHEELGAMGFFGFGVSDAHGGLGFDDAFMRAAASEEMARAGGTGVWAGVGGRGISRRRGAGSQGLLPGNY